MVYYKDNPNLTSLKIVTTIKGDKEYRRNTKYIKEEYHTINRDCFQFNDKWYTIKSGNIVYDYENKQYVLKNKAYSLIMGLVRNDDDELIIGYFTANPYNNITTESKSYGRIMAINLEVLENDWFEDLGSNIWRPIKEFTPEKIKSLKRIRNDKGYTNRGYNIEDNTDYQYKIELHNNYKHIISEKIKELSTYIGDLTFGVEIEVSEGCLPDFLKNRYGVVICRDGSLDGGAEIVTIPLKGAKGLQTLVNLVSDLKDRVNINLNCSFHIHFGNIPTDKLSLISLYRLSRNIQSELFSMFPYYKTSPGNIKQKNYTKKLLKLNINTLKDFSKEAYELYLADSWRKMFNFYSDGRITPEDFNKKTRNHPATRKWEISSRYYYMNLLNLFFGHRHTVESRLSSGTVNIHKIINWFLINVAIIKYSQKYSKEIISSDKTISLKEILEIFPTLYPKNNKSYFISKYLYEYIIERQNLFKRDLEKNDYASMWDIEEDKDYEFEYMGVKGLI